MFNFQTTLELVIFIIGVCCSAFSVAGIFLSMKNRGGKAFKLVSLLVLPIMALTSMFSLLFISLKAFGDLLGLQIALAFVFSVACEFLAVGIAKLASRNAHA